MRYLSCLCRFHFVGATFGLQEFIRNLKHFVLQYFCNFNSQKNLHLPVGQVKNRIHLPDRKIHQPRAVRHDFLCTLDQMQFQANCVKSHHCIHVLSERPWLQNQCFSLSHHNSVYLHQFHTINPVQNHQIKVIIMNQTYSVRW